jgi:hypothetical protein
MLIAPKLASGIGKAFACAVAIASTIAPSGRADAAGVTLQCSRADVANPKWNAPITFSYEGDGRGTLKVGGVFGEFAIPASHRSVQIKSSVTIEMFVGAAKAHVKKLPSLSDVEICIDKVPGSRSGAAGSDAFLNARDQCMRELPAASSGVDVMAQIELRLDGESGGGEDGYVLFKLIYDAPSRAPDGKMVVEAFPAQCTLKK